jgi:hypothetical protein
MSQIEEQMKDSVKNIESLLDNSTLQYYFDDVEKCDSFLKEHDIIKMPYYLWQWSNKNLGEKIEVFLKEKNFMISRSKGTEKPTNKKLTEVKLFVYDPDFPQFKIIYHNEDGIILTASYQGFKKLFLESIIPKNDLL